MAQIDINCDMGESYGNFRIGNDEQIFPYITSCNIACGFHGGDPLHIEHTIKSALQHGVQVGAHPGYPDLSGFGRRRMHIPSEELRALVKYQVAALKAMTESCGGQMTYVKPHGALYNTAADVEQDARSIAQAVAEIDPNLMLMGMPDSCVQQAAKDFDLHFIAEAFADRRYEDNGRLRSRTLEGAVLSSPDEAADQVISIVAEHQVETFSKNKIALQADSICIHGDNPEAVAILQSIDRALKVNNIPKKGFGQ